MPDPTYLQIQAEHSSAAQVVPLEGVLVRIGRGAQCEVCLEGHDLADVQCVLRKRGREWYIQPLGAAGSVTVAGRALADARVLPMGTAVGVAGYQLTLQPADAWLESAASTLAAPLYSAVGRAGGGVATLVPTVVRAESAPTELPPAPEPPSPAADPECERERLRGRLAERASWLESRQEQRRWEARWRAARARLKAREAPVFTTRAPISTTVPSTPLAPEPSPPAAPRRPDPPSRADLGVARLPRQQPAPLPRTAPRAAPPSVDRPQTVERKPQAPAPSALPRVVAPAPAAAPSTELPPEPSETRFAVFEEPLAALLEQIAPPGHAPEPPVQPAADRERRASRPVTGRAPARPLPSEQEPTRVPSAPIPPLVARQPAPSRERDCAAPSAPAEGTPRWSASAQNRGTLAKWTSEEPEWDLPSARAILAAHAPAPRPSATPPRRPAQRPRRVRAARPQPTAGQPPAQWTLRIGALWLAACAVTLMIGPVGIALCWLWARDDAAAGVLADGLLSARPRAQAAQADRLPQLAPEPDPTWWRTTADHLFLRALALAHAPADADSAEQVRFLLHAARSATPLSAAVRFAEAQQPAPHSAVSENAPGFQPSRDTVALGLLAHRLLQAGKNEAALRVDAAALDMALRTRLRDLDPPSFRDDAEHPRFRLPYEDLVAPIISELAAQRELAFETWSKVLPPAAVAFLSAAEALKGQGRVDEGERALDRALEQLQQPPPGGSSTAVQLAACAEAFARRGRWREAEERYRQAIEQVKVDVIRRSWWLNLADIDLRLGDDAHARLAWEYAKNGDPNDEITRRAVEYQKQAGLPFGVGHGAGAAPAGFAAPGEHAEPLAPPRKEPPEPATPAAEPTAPDHAASVAVPGSATAQSAPVAPAAPVGRPADLPRKPAAAPSSVAPGKPLGQPRSQVVIPQVSAVPPSPAPVAPSRGPEPGQTRVSAAELRLPALPEGARIDLRRLRAAATTQAPKVAPPLSQGR